MNTNIQKKIIEQQFSKYFLKNLRKFSEYLFKIQADIIILMARKAVCLFDVFELLDIPKPDVEIVSDRILDLNPIYFKDKKVVVVDDTLIVGTTLNKVKQKLLRLNINHKIIVFCADINNWSQELINPDYCQLKENSDRVLEFCVSEVNAFTVATRPYLIDFPITNYVSLNSQDLLSFLDNKHIKSFELPYYSSNIKTNKNYTVFLSDEIKQNFFNKVGEAFAKIIEFLKIRIFINNIENKNNLRLVPIVLLKALKKEDINSIFNEIVQSSKYSTDFKFFIIGEKLKYRFIQYYLSIILGQIFIQHSKIGIPDLGNLRFKTSEIINLLGKEIGEKFENHILETVINVENVIPEAVDISYLDNEYFEFFKDIDLKSDALKSFQKVFSKMYKNNETEFRKSVKNNNFDYNDDRLLKGLPFITILNAFSRKINKQINSRDKELFSLLLDVCNDFGISVPVIRKLDNDIYSRAFRYGELGERSDWNDFLFYKFLENFCSFNQRDPNHIGHLLLEKLSVLFYRIGSYQEFIDISPHPTSKTLCFNHYLMGAILTTSQERFTGNHDVWYINTLCDIGILKENEDNSYALQNPPKIDENSLSKQDLRKAVKLGKVFGRYVKNPESDKPQIKESILDNDALTIIASAFNYSELSMALAAEIDIINCWLDYIRDKLKTTKLTFEIFNHFSTKIVYKTFNQALFKLKASLIDGAELLIKNITKEIKLKDDYPEDWEEIIEILSLSFSYDKNSDQFLLENILKASNRLFYIGNLFHQLRILFELYEIRIKNPKVIINSEFWVKEKGKTGNAERRVIVKKLKKETLEYELGFREYYGRLFFGKETSSVIYDEKTKKTFIITKINNNNIVETSGMKVFEKFNLNIKNLNLVGEMQSKYLNVPSNYQSIKERILSFRNNVIDFDIEFKNTLASIFKENEYLIELKDKIISNYERDHKDNLLERFS